MVKKIEKSEIERRPLLQRALSTALTGMLAMSACGMSMGTFAVEALGAPCDGSQTEKVIAELIENDVAAVFATGDATVSCNGHAITGQQTVSIPAEKELIFTVTPHEGFAVEEVSFQMLSEGVLDVLVPTEGAEDASYAVSADKMTEGMAIVVNTVAIPAETAEQASISEVTTAPVAAQEASDAVETAEETASVLFPGGEASRNELVFNPFYDPTALTVTGRPSSVNVKDVEKVYDGQPVSVKATAEKAGSTLLYYTEGMSGWSTENPQFTDAGAYTVLVKAVNQNDPETDVATAHVTVKPAPVVIKVHDAEKTVGSTDPVFGGDIEGLLSGDEIGSVIYYRLNNGVEEAGFYAEALSALVQHRNGNYSYTVEPGSFTIAGGIDAPAQNPMSDPAAPAAASSPSQSEPVNSNLVTEFAQGEGMQRFTEGVVEPIATLLGVAKADRATISDDDTPLAAFESDEQESGWAHLPIIFGLLIAAVAGAIVVLRRLRLIRFFDGDLDEALPLDPRHEDKDALPALDALWNR